MCGKTAWKNDVSRLLDDVARDLAAAARSAAQHAGADEDAPLLREESELSVFPGVPLS